MITFCQAHLRWNRSTTEKPFKCPVKNCDKSFTAKSSLKNHMNTHSRDGVAEQIVSCLMCNINFNSHQVLKSHLILKHGLIDNCPVIDNTSESTNTLSKLPYQKYIVSERNMPYKLASEMSATAFDQDSQRLANEVLNIIESLDSDPCLNIAAGDESSPRVITSLEEVNHVPTIDAPKVQLCHPVSTSPACAAVLASNSLDVNITNNTTADAFDDYTDEFLALLDSVCGFDDDDTDSLAAFMDFPLNHNLGEPRCENFDPMVQNVVPNANISCNLGHHGNPYYYSSYDYANISSNQSRGAQDNNISYMHQHGFLDSAVVKDSPIVNQVPITSPYKRSLDAMSDGNILSKSLEDRQEIKRTRQ